MNSNNFVNEYLSVNKIFNHLDRVEELMNTGDILPIMMEIDPINSCIHKCPACFLSGNRFADASLSIDFMKNAIDQTSSFLKSIVFTGGGEPLCNTDTIEAIKYAASKKLSVALITNGELIDKEKAETIVSNCEWVRISIDAFTTEEYLKIHGMDESHLQKVWHNVDLLIEAKKKFLAKCTIGVAYLVNGENRKNMFSFAEKARKAGVDYCQFRPFHYSDFDFTDSLLKTKVLEDDKFKVIASMQRIDKEEGEFDVCLGDYLRTVLAADGYLYPCCFTRGHKEFRLGNLAKDDFLTIWKSEKKKEIFKNKLKFPDAPFLRLCKFDYLNKLLWTIKQAKKLKHINFI
jgi:radical SAM protein with 4Fe4S-binding SPASM domain